MEERPIQMIDTITIRYAGGNADREVDEYLQQLAQEKGTLKVFRNAVVENERLVIIGLNHEKDEALGKEAAVEIVFQLGQMGLFSHHDTWEEYPSA